MELNASNLIENLSNPQTAQKLSPNIGNQLSQDDFMRLLLTQLKMQSPTNPFDSNTMMQQVSQLTALSATQELQKSVKDMRANMGASQMLEASQTVGKFVQIPRDTSPLGADGVLRGSVVVPEQADKVSVTLRDTLGKTIKTLELGAPSAGVVDFTWDGLDDSGKPQPAGYYALSASAFISGESVSIPTAGTFKVNSVAMDRNHKEVILNLDGVGGVGLEDIIKIL